jgi:hypothetical protein
MRGSGDGDSASSSGRAAGGDAAASAATATATTSTEWLSTKNCLLGVGAACLLGMVHFYRRKHTVGFKACWAVM